MKASVHIQPGNRKGYLKVRSPMTFYIPHSLLDVFEQGVNEENGSVRDYLQSLLLKYRPLFNHGLLPSSDGDRCTREYQPRLEEERKKVNFRPNSEDWAEISNVALAHGVSVCNFFSLLLRLEAVGCGADDKVAALWVGIPTTLFVKSTLTQQFRQPEKVYERRYHQTQFYHPALSPEVVYYETEFG